MYCGVSADSRQVGRTCTVSSYNGVCAVSPPAVALALSACALSARAPSARALQRVGTHAPTGISPTYNPPSTSYAMTRAQRNPFCYLCTVCCAHADEIDACAFETEEDGRYCPNGYVAFIGSCRGDYQSNLTATSTQQKRRKTVTTEKEWSPATDATAPFSIVLISRPFGDPEAAADCSSLPYQTYFTVSRDAADFDSQILWKNREISLFSYEAGFALSLSYGSSIPW